MKTITLLLFAFTISLSAQLTEITKFPLQDTNQSHFTSSIIELDNNELLFFFVENKQLKMSKRSDGINWSATTLIIDSLVFENYYNDLATYKTNSGKIIVAYKSNGQRFIISSIDNGVSWSNSEPFFDSANVKFSQTDDNKLWYAFNSVPQFLDYVTSDDDGVTWSEKTRMPIYARHLTALSVNTSLMLFYSASGTIFGKSSEDGGNTWFITRILDDSNIYSYPSVVKKNDSTLVLIYLMENNTTIGDYYFIESSNAGLSWGTPKQFTKYIGSDSHLSINSNSQKFYASFSSDRDFHENNFISKERTTALWYGIVGTSEDVFTPPEILNIEHTLATPTSLDTITISALILDDEAIDQVFLHYTINEVLQDSIQMFDDGLHNDGAANDLLFGVSLFGQKSSDFLKYSISATDNRENYSLRFGGHINLGIPNANETYYLDINRFKLPLDNKGVLSDSYINGVVKYATFDDIVVLGNAGFGLTGFDNTEFWANAVFPSGRVEDYQPGIVGSGKDDLVNKVYPVTKYDVPFGDSWKSWGYAVKQGAKFYDGDGDGVYNPIDLDSNGVWDANEDRPDLIGDAMAWTVFNDGVPSSLRLYDMKAKNIEIKQTTFGYSPNTHPELNGVIFVRYEIENKSSNEYSSVYFSVFGDADIGDYGNDLIGCDTIINSGYMYDNGDDNIYGNSPTFMQTIIQGAPTYISGKTFTDNNSNGIYDEGIDTPLDTAKYRYGNSCDNKIFVGAKNQIMNSFMHGYKGFHYDPYPTYSSSVLRIAQLGGKMYYSGDSIYVSTFMFGNGNSLGVDTVGIPSHYLFSGNPVTNEGWIDLAAMGAIMTTSGPFTIKPNEPVEIIVAYVVGRGATSLESVDVTKKIAQDAIGFYNTNFSYVPVGVNGKPQTQLPTKYSLSQNYPNPFNPSTTISYAIPVVETLRATSKQVTLKIFDILGREVATLINQKQRAGNYEVQFDATNLTSGVYFYQLKSGSFIESKKMVLLK